MRQLRISSSGSGGVSGANSNELRFPHLRTVRAHLWCAQRHAASRWFAYRRDASRIRAAGVWHAPQRARWLASPPHGCDNQPPIAGWLSQPADQNQTRPRRAAGRNRSKRHKTDRNGGTQLAARLGPPARAARSRPLPLPLPPVPARAATARSAPRPPAPGRDRPLRAAPPAPGRDRSERGGHGGAMGGLRRRC